MERAAALAEKFKDFGLLIEMCINNDDYDRMFSYIEKYSSEVDTLFSIFNSVILILSLKCLFNHQLLYPWI